MQTYNYLRFEHKNYRYFLLQVRYELPNGTKRCYKFNKFVKPAREQRIPDLNVTVEKYFLVR